MTNESEQSEESSNTNQESKPISKQDILRIFTDSAAKDKTPLIGIEAEKVGIDGRSGKSAKYTGKGGYLAILGKLYEELGWEIIKQDGKYILQLQRGNSNLNLESDGRIELAGGPHESIHDLAREFRIHQNEISEISHIFGINWLGIGYHPVSKNKDIEDLSSPRKDQLVKIFKDVKNRTKNDFGLAWFKKTSGIHVNIDYTSEEDFALKSKVFYRLAPLLVGIFANSPFSKNKFTGHMSYRYHVTLNTGIPRFRINKELYDSEFRFQDWVDHICSLPLFFFNRGEEWIKPGITFNEFMENGYKDTRATMDDFSMHTKSLWKDVKMKNVIEIRCIDSLPPSLVPSVAALIKGIAYNKDAMEACWNMVKHWNYHEYAEFQENVAKYGWHTEMHGVKALDLAKELVTIAETSLKQDRIFDAYKKSEAKYLEEIKEFIFVKGGSPAEWIVKKWKGGWRGSFFPAFDWCQY